MFRSLSRASLLFMLALLTACGGSRYSSGDGSSNRVQRNILTREQLVETSSRNAYEAIEALRGHWLRIRGLDSFRSPGEVKVYFNDTMAGGVEYLRQVSPREISYVQYFDGIEATGRWGLDHGHGVIYVSTRPR